MIEALIEALTSALEQEVVLYEDIPDSIEPPAVIVAPGNPFIENTTLDEVKENWQVLVAVNNQQYDRGVATFRRVSLLIRQAASSVGAIWTGAAGPQQTGFTGPQHALVINRLYFSYDPVPYTAPEESSSSSSS